MSNHGPDHQRQRRQRRRRSDDGHMAWLDWVELMVDIALILPRAIAFVGRGIFNLFN